MLKGNIHITSNLHILNTIPIQSTRIVSLDDDGLLDNSPYVIIGTCLLPPPQAKIAEADGNEQLYDMIYSNYLWEPHNQEFITALIAYLYKGGNLVIYLPNEDDNTRVKFLFHLYNLYGIRIGDLDSNDPNLIPCFYNDGYRPLWIDMIYNAGIISAYEFLYYFPENIPLSIDRIMNGIIDEIKPYGNNMAEMIEYIQQYHIKIHKNPKLIPAIYSMR